MMTKLSQLISYISHPLLIPTYTFGLVILLLPTSAIYPLRFMFLPFLTFTTFVIPCLSLFILKTFGSISNYTLPNRKDRFIPFLYISVFYFMTAYMFIFKIGANLLVSSMLISTCLLILSLALITLRFKISIHAAAMAGVVSFLWTLNLHYTSIYTMAALIAAILCLGIVMAARLKLDAHSLKEVFYGAMLGLFVNYLGIFWVF